jgi:hypothetical protein
MCLDSGGYYNTTPKAPDGAGYTVADVTKGTDKYSKVYDKDNKDITSDVEYDTSTSKYKKKQTTNAAVDSYAGAY